MVCLQSLHSVGVVTILGCLYSIFTMPFILFCIMYSDLFCNHFCLFLLIDFLFYYMWFWFCKSISHIILHSSYFLLFFWYMILHSVCVIRIMGCTLVGVLFFCICTNTYVCISYSPCSMYSCDFFYFPIIFIFCIPYFLVHITPSFTFSKLCEIYPWLDENFWGDVCMCLNICSYMCILKYVYHDINYHRWYH